MSANETSLSARKLSRLLLEAVERQGVDAPLRRLVVEFAEDADSEFAMFITGVVEADAATDAVDEGRLLKLVNALHDGARALDLGVRWYVRIEAEDAVAEDTSI